MKHWKKLLAVLCIPLLFFLIFFYPYKQVIAFLYEDQDQLLAYLSLEQDKTFQITYTHSIHLSDVTEFYHLADDEIMLTELAYEDFAVGMPSNAEGDEVFEEIAGTYHIKNMNRSFSFIDLRIGQVRANHRLVYENKTFTLSDYVKAGTWVRISPKKITLWQQLKGVNING